MTAPLANLAYWNSGYVSPDEANGPSGQAFLAALHQYDPQAAFVDSNAQGASDNVNMTPYMSLSYNPSKLPGVSVPGASWGGNGGASLGPNETTGDGSGWMPGWQSIGADTPLWNKGAVVNSPVYGAITANGNINQNAGGLFGVMDKVLPYAVMSALGYGAGVAGTSLLSGLAPTLGNAVTGAAGNWLGGTALNEAMSGGSARFNPLSLGGIASAALGLPSWVPSAATTLAGLAKGGSLAFSPYALAARFAPFLFGGGGGGG